MNKPKIGEIFTTNQGCELKVICINSEDEYTVKFTDDSGYERVVKEKNLMSGRVKNPFHPSVRGVGFFGVGPHLGKVGKGNKPSKEYGHWTNMLNRCYVTSYQERFPTYIGCSVDQQWYNFQEFAEWCQWQIGFRNKNSVLDKDLIKPGNKVYGPETCVFLPPELNNLIVTPTRNDKQTPIGISFQKKYQKYIVSCAVDGKNKNLGRYECQVEAFSVYKKFKENLIKEKACQYKEIIDERAFHALINYEVRSVNSLQESNNIKEDNYAK